MRKLLYVILAVCTTSCVKAEPQPAQNPGASQTTYPTTQTPAPGVYTLQVFQTSDIHGYIVNTDSDRTHYRLSYAAHKINGYAKENRLLLDGGDIYQGASVSNLLDGEPLYTAMDMMGYDAVALGNHEFDWGLESVIDPDATLLDYDWEGERHVNSIPIVCANMFWNGSRTGLTRDYVIVEKQALNAEGAPVTVKIGVIGFAVNYASSIMTSKFAGLGYSIKDDYSIADDLALELESSGRCDATIMLVHGSAPSCAPRLGTGTVIDLVLGGHSHRYENGVTENGLPYLQAGGYCQNFASASLSFTVDQEGAVSFAGVGNPQIIFVNAQEDCLSENLDPGIMEVSDKALGDISAQINSVIGHIDTDATKAAIRGSGQRCTTMGNWMCDILRRIGEADVAFVNGGGVRAEFPLDGHPTRDITVANVYEMFPFNNTTYVYNLTYKELLTVIEYSLSERGAELFTCMRGIICYFNASGEVRRLVKDSEVIYNGGVWADDWASRTVTLAVSEYVATTQKVNNTTGQGNPLIEWNKTPRLLYSNLVDNENAILVLRRESESSGGLLSIDPVPHYRLVE